VFGRGVFLKGESFDSIVIVVPLHVSKFYRVLKKLTAYRAPVRCQILRMHFMLSVAYSALTTVQFTPKNSRLTVRPPCPHAVVLFTSPLNGSITGELHSSSGASLGVISKQKNVFGLNFGSSDVCLTLTGVEGTVSYAIFEPSFVPDKYVISTYRSDHFIVATRDLCSKADFRSRPGATFGFFHLNGVMSHVSGIQSGTDDGDLIQFQLNAKEPAREWTGTGEIVTQSSGLGAWSVKLGRSGSSKAVALSFSATSGQFPTIRKKFTNASLFVLLEAGQASGEDERPISQMCQFVRESVEKLIIAEMPRGRRKKSSPAAKEPGETARSNSEQVATLQKSSRASSPRVKNSALSARPPKRPQKKPLPDAHHQKNSQHRAAAKPPVAPRRAHRRRGRPVDKVSEAVYYVQNPSATPAPPRRAVPATLSGLLLVGLVGLLAGVYCAISPGRRAGRMVESDVELLIPSMITKAPVNRQTEMADNVSPLDYDRGDGELRVSFDTVP
jgi:hypothetical protein